VRMHAQGAPVRGTCAMAEGDPEVWGAVADALQDDDLFPSPAEAPLPNDFAAPLPFDLLPLGCQVGAAENAASNSSLPSVDGDGDATTPGSLGGAADSGEEAVTSGKGTPHEWPGKNTVAKLSEVRKEKMAAACRRFRAKRKEEVNELKRKNEVLEDEGHQLLVRIAQLQTEAQTFRDRGALDLQRENELLRSEIRLHKRFIADIVSTANKIPAMSDQELVRIIAEGINSAAGQSIGLCYTSAGDPSWKVAAPTFIDGQAVHTRIQTLPLGLPEPEAKRINIRFDFPDRMETPSKLENILWKMWSNPEINMELCKSHFPELSEKRNFVLKQRDLGIDANRRAEFPELNDVRLFHVTEQLKASGDVVQDMMCFFGKKSLKVQPSALPEALREQFGDPCRCLDARVLVTTTSKTLHETFGLVSAKDESGAAAMYPMTEAFCVIPTDSGGAHVSYVASFPITSELLVRLRPPLIDADGELYETLTGIASMLLALISGQIEPYAASRAAIGCACGAPPTRQST